MRCGVGQFGNSGVEILARLKGTSVEGGQIFRTETVKVAWHRLSRSVTYKLDRNGFEGTRPSYIPAEDAALAWLGYLGKLEAGLSIAAAKLSSELALQCAFWTRWSVFFPWTSVSNDGLPSSRKNNQVLQLPDLVIHLVVDFNLPLPLHSLE